MYKRSFKDYFSRNRKALYMILGILLVSTLSLTIVYAALSVTLNIVGTAEVSSASWDVHLDNVKVTSGSVSGDAPTISGGTTATFSTKLEVPGDFYEFTIDVVNSGSIDAMIDSVTKTPTLTTAQAKYLNYIVEYQNGESINTRQLVEKNSFVRLKVRVEFRNDITASDLPTTSETLNLSFKVNYVQSNKTTGISVPGKGIVQIVNGDFDTVGSEVCIGEECFNVISSTTDTVTMLAKYNLGRNNMQTPTIDYNDYYVAYTFDTVTPYKLLIEEGANELDTNSLNRVGHNWGLEAPAGDDEEYDGIVLLEDYLSYLKTSLGDSTISIRNISVIELLNLGCTGMDKNYNLSVNEYGGYIYPTCINSPYKDMLFNGQNWYTSTVYRPELENSCSNNEWCIPFMFFVYGDPWNTQYINEIWAQDFTTMDIGIRPVITISKSLF